MKSVNGRMDPLGRAAMWIATTAVFAILAVGSTGSAWPGYARSERASLDIGPLPPDRTLLHRGGPAKYHLLRDAPLMARPSTIVLRPRPTPSSAARAAREASTPALSASQ